MYRRILFNPYVIWTILFLLMQQLIVASSTFWITDLSEAVVAGHNFYPYLILFVTSLFVVYIPGIFAGYNLEKAKSKAIYQYIQLFSETHRCFPAVLTEKKFQSDREPWLTNEGGRTIEESFGIAYDTLATGLNTTLNIIALCIAIDTRIAIGYFFSFIILPLISTYFKNKIAHAALTMQNDRKTLSDILLSGWDNIIIGNVYNVSIWWREFSKRWSAYNHSSAKSVLIMQIASSSATIVSLIPIACIFVWIFHTTTNPAKLAALIATLPRQIQIIQHFEILSTYAMHWYGIVAKIKTLIANVTSPTQDKNELIKRIDHNEIALTINESGTRICSIEDGLKKIARAETGRITIKGKNGSGKSTLMSLIKKEYGDHAFYLPTHSNLMFETTLQTELSTGQRVKSYLEELISLSNFKLLLLDEWDANLDLANAKLISDLLDHFAKKICIVEISHRQ